VKSPFSKEKKNVEYYDIPKSPPRLPVDVVERLENPHVIRGIIDVLIICSGFYRRAGNDSICVYISTNMYVYLFI
jgi:hypothetical protein